MSNVLVAVRARPFSQREVDLKSTQVVEMRGHATVLHKTREGIIVGEVKDDSKEFVYDHSYWSVDPRDSHYTTQEKVFTDLGKMVLESAFEGYNVCVFAYGQTGSGKTYTMMGSETAPGLIPRICEQLFFRIASGSLKKVSYRTEASYMEIYNEKVRDLLDQRGNKSPAGLRVREHPRTGPYVENLSKHVVMDYQSIRQFMDTGNQHRATASTKMNDVSSRSHAIFTITFTQAAYSADLPCETVSKINLVDLAGSERASLTGAEGIRLKEGGIINKSLVCLGNVISALADMSSHSHSHKKPHIPYRDSVLTWLLKDSLGGNSKTIMIATVSPAESSYGESLSTLRYASRAKSIVNKPVVNEDPNVKLIRELRAEIRRLRSVISKQPHQETEGGEMRDRANSIILAADIYRKEEQIAALTRNWAERWKSIQQIIEERNLALQSEGVKMRVASDQPHFLAIDEDIFGTGLVLYYLHKGQTTIGSSTALPTPDIALTAAGIEPEHCVVEYQEEQVELQPRSGRCMVNNVPVDTGAKLTHGDLVQLSDTTVFRFNHLQEASRMRKSQHEIPSRNSLLEMSSPLTSSHYEQRNALAEQKSALEKDYEQRLQQMREQIEKEREEEVASLKEEVERLRQSQLLPAESGSDSQEEVDGDPYNLMRSIMFEPVLHKYQSLSPEPISREVIGEEAAEDSVSFKLRASPVMSNSQVSSHSTAHNGAQNGVYSTDTNGFLSPPLESCTLQRLPQESRDMRTSTPLSNGHLDLRFIRTNLAQFDLQSPDGKSTTCTPEPSEKEGTAAVETEEGAIAICSGVQTSLNYPELMWNSCRTDASDWDSTENSRGREDMVSLELELRAAKEQRQQAELFRAEAEKRHRDAEQKRLSVEAQFTHERERIDQEKQQLQKRLEEVEDKLTKKHALDDLEPTVRRRSYAFGERERGGRANVKRSRSHSRSRRGTPSVKVEVPGFYLRGKGLTSYHLYTIKLRVGADSWVIYKRYTEFKRFHETMKVRYPELSALSLPPSKWFGFRDEVFVEKRRRDLELYLQTFVALCSNIRTCPLAEIGRKGLTKAELEAFSSFFMEGNLGIDSESIKLVSP